MKYLFLVILFFISNSQCYETISLKAAESTVFSQNGEDGVIKKIFDLIKPKYFFAVEFGAGDGFKFSNTASLLNQGWKRIGFEGILSKKAPDIFQEFITPLNVNDIFAKYEIPYDFDFLSIDVDLNDFYIWAALHYRPKVVLIEYNNSYGLEDKIVSLEINGVWDYTDYQSASLKNMCKLAQIKGYTLIHTTGGFNAFFLRNDLLESLHLTFENQGDYEIHNKKVTNYYRPSDKNTISFKEALELLRENEIKIGVHNP
jgi:hypothetical protein